MTNETPNRGSRLNTIILIIILIVIAAGAYLIVQSIRDMTQAASAPFQQVQQANEAVQTQISQLLHPSPTIIPDPVTYINEVQALARMETIQYSIEKVITAEQGQGFFGFLVGDRLLFVAHGVVIAGIDMEKLQPEDLRFEDGVLYVKLPPAEIFIATLDNEKSYIYDREQGILSQDNFDLETDTRRVAEEEIHKAAIEDGILEQAQVNAEAYLLKFFSALGYQAVIFEDQG